MKPLSAIILAGGKSKRMKYNKEYIMIDGQYLVHRQINELKQQFQEIIVVSGNPEHYKDFDVLVVQDQLKGQSPIIGLHAGLLASTNDYNYVIACDMPYINHSFITHLINLITKHDAYVSLHNQFIEPFNAIYHKRIVPDIKALVEDDDYGFQNMVNTINAYKIPESEVAKFLVEMDMFKNINNESDLFNIDTTSSIEYREYTIEKIIDHESYIITDKVITEYPLNCYVNGDYVFTLMTTPSNLEFLVIGHLITEEMIDSIKDIISLDIQLKDHKAMITLKNKHLHSTLRRAHILSSACGGHSNLSQKDIMSMVVDNESVFDLSSILEEVADFNKESILFKETGGVHSVKLIYDDKELLIEDIGRHNAVDKVVGFMIKNRIDPANAYIITSGRISSDILLKCAVSNIGLIVSRSAPTSLCINLAHDLDITVLGFARGNKVNIYTHGKRIRKV